MGVRNEIPIYVKITLDYHKLIFLCAFYSSELLKYYYHYNFIEIKFIVMPRIGRYNIIQYNRV